MITPMDIHNKTFSKQIRGYSSEEVNSFLEELAGDYKRIYRELREMEEEMDAILARVIHPQIDANRASRTRVSNLADNLREPLRIPSLALLAAALLVLATGAANVGGLLAVRALRRRGELASDWAPDGAI